MNFVVGLLIIAIVIYGFRKVFGRWREQYSVLSADKPNLEDAEYKERLGSVLGIHLSLAAGVFFVGLFLWMGYLDLMTPADVIRQQAENYKAQKAQKPGSEINRVDCVRYEAARQECATAAKVGQCVEIKLGVNDAYMGQSLCN